MKSELVKNNTIKSEFPKLMSNNHSFLIVLFVSSRKGMVVSTECTDHKLGEIHDDWIIDNFKPFKDSIVLSND